MGKIDKKELHNIFYGIINGNELEFNKLYERYKTLVYGVAFSILKNKEDSEEIVQTVFMKIFKLEKEKLPKDKEASWLYQVTKNEVINFLRNKKQDLDIDNLYYITDSGKQIEEVIDMDSYNKIIQKLNEKERKIVSLKILSNLSFKEISQVLNIPMGTVQWKYYRSIHTLKMLIGNLSMFILTIIVFITNKLIDNRENEKKHETIKEEIDKSKNEIEEEGTEKVREDQVKQETIDITENTEQTTDTVVIEKENGISFSIFDIGILSFCSIFFVLTVTFFIFFVKSQQRLKKKTSK